MLNHTRETLFWAVAGWAGEETQNHSNSVLGFCSSSFKINLFITIITGIDNIIYYYIIIEISIVTILLYTTTSSTTIIILRATRLL